MLVFWLVRVLCRRQDGIAGRIRKIEPCVGLDAVGHDLQPQAVGEVDDGSAIAAWSDPEGRSRMSSLSIFSASRGKARQVRVLDRVRPYRRGVHPLRHAPASTRCQCWNDCPASAPGTRVNMSVSRPISPARQLSAASQAVKVDRPAGQPSRDHGCGPTPSSACDTCACSRIHVSTRSCHMRSRSSGLAR